jgi:small subunit ribosomal protein S10e
LVEAPQKKKRLYKMIIPKANRKKIYTKLFKDGVMVAEKAFNAPAHPEFPDVPNLQVIKACQSLKSRGYVKENFAWRHYYWALTDEGIEYIKNFLHLPAEVVPDTLKAPAKEQRPRQMGSRFGDRAASGRDGYRRGGDKSVGSDVNFRGGAGRGSRFGQ